MPPVSSRRRWGAQSWPSSRTIRVVCPFPLVGATDVLARMMAQRLSETWGANVIVENKPGAGGNIGAEQVAKGEPDGSQILIVSVGMATNRFLYPASPTTRWAISRR